MITLTERCGEWELKLRYENIFLPQYLSQRLSYRIILYFGNQSIVGRDQIPIHEADENTFRNIFEHFFHSPDVMEFINTRRSGHYRTNEVVPAVPE